MTTRPALFFVMSLLLLPLSSWGASLTFDNFTDANNVTVTAGQFESGFSVNGSQIQSPGLGSGSTTVAESTGVITYTGTWIDNGTVIPYTRTIYFIDPASTVTDILVINVSSGTRATISGTWTTNAGGPLGPVPGGTPAGDIIAADGTSVGFSAAFLSGSARAGVLTDVAVSSVENSDDPVIAGATAPAGRSDFTFTLTNNGPFDASNVVANFSASTTGGLWANPTACIYIVSQGTFSWPTWSVGSITNLATATINEVCPAGSNSQAGATRSLTLSMTSMDQTDSNTGNDSSTESATIVRSSDLVLTSKTDAPDPVIAGTQLTYTITVNNDGPSDADNVTVVDSLPTGLTYVSDTDSCVEAPTGTLTCNVGTLATQTGTSFDIVAAVNVSLAHNTILSNSASVGSDSPDPDVSNNNNEAVPTLTTVITEAYWDVTKTWTDDSTTAVNITLTCNDVEVDSGVATPGAGPTTLTVTGFDNGNTSCTVTEEVPDRTFEEYSIDCSVADVVSATTYTCDIINAPSLATFEVRKRFMDGNDATQVTFNISCNDGLPLNSSLTVFPDQGEFVRGEAEVTFVVELFAPGSMDCTVSEEKVPNYTATYVCGVFGNPTVCTDGDPSRLDNFGDGPCIFENVDSASAGTSRNFCTIRNYPDPATYTVNKEWVVLGSGGDLVEQLARIKIWCDTEIRRGIQSGQRWYKIFEEVGDFSPSVTIVPDYPSSNCWAEERIFSDAVESQNDCDGDALVAGGSASCDIINTVFYEGIPTLNPYGLALLALLMLAVGAVGFRRFG